MKFFNKLTYNAMRLERLLAEQYGQSKSVFFTYMFLRAIILAVIVLSVLGGHYENLLACIVALVLFSIPPIIERRLNADFTTFFEIFVLIFIFSAYLLGEIAAFYVRIPGWDTLLHGTSGFMMAAFGFSIIDLIHKDSSLKFKLSPFYMAYNSFAFTMTISVLWEFFECFMDTFFGRDMQKDYIITKFQSVTLDPTKSNIPIVVDNIKSVTINGEPLPFEGYLDIGLLDTMKDLSIAALGAFIFSIFAFAYIKTGGKNKFVAIFVPVTRDWEEKPPVIESEFAERIAKFEEEMAERRAQLDAELDERKKKFEEELRQKEFESSFKKDKIHDGITEAEEDATNDRES